MKEHTKNYITFVLWICAAAIIIGSVAIVFYFEHVPSQKITASSGSSIDQPTSTVAMQTFTSQKYHYAFSVPQSWYIENDGDESISMYPDYDPKNAKNIPLCKIELSIFPDVINIDPSTWIAQRLGADNSVAVSQSSIANIFIGNDPAIKWTGTVDGNPAVFVYAFKNNNAYEIAPSLVSGGSDPTMLCADDLSAFLGDLNLEPH